MTLGEAVSSNDSSDESEESVAAAEESFDDGSDADDPFSFKKKSFSRKRKADSDSDNDDDSSDDDGSYSAPRTKRGIVRNCRKKKSVEERLAALQKRKRTSLSTSDDDSDDSDVEIIGEDPASVSPKLGNVDFLSSDDEEVTAMPPRGLPNYSSASLEGVKAIQQARDARRALVRAQKYHAEDVRVALPPPQHLPHNPMVQALNYEQIHPPNFVPLHSMAYGAGVSPMPPPHASFPVGVQPVLYPPQGGVMPPTASPILHASAASNRKNLGKAIMLNLRTMEYVNGKPLSSSATDIVFSISMHEPLQRLVDKFLKARNHPPASTKVVFTFDGRQLSMDKTPASYEMEDDDLVDVVVKVISFPSATSHPSAASNKRQGLGPEIMLTLRVQDIKSGKKKVSPIQDVLSVRQRQPLSVLLEKFKKKRKLGSKHIVMSFDGLELDLNKSPTDFDMEDEDMIDVTVEH